MQISELITNFTKTENLALVDGCMIYASEQLPNVERVGALVRTVHKVGQTNSSTYCSTKRALTVGQMLGDNLASQTEAKPHLFGNRIRETYSLFKQALDTYKK